MRERGFGQAVQARPPRVHLVVQTAARARLVWSTLDLSRSPALALPSARYSAVIRYSFPSVVAVMLNLPAGRYSFAQVSLQGQPPCEETAFLFTHSSS